MKPKSEKMARYPPIPAKAFLNSAKIIVRISAPNIPLMPKGV